MRFLVPYASLGGRVLRPWLPVRILGPRGEAHLDGLLDTGADWTLLPHEVGLSLGIRAEQLSTQINIATGSDHSVRCGIASVTLEIRREGRRLAWRAEVAIALKGVRKVHWGQRGFLEYFRAEFDGMEKRVSLSSNRNLSRVRLA